MAGLACCVHDSSPLKEKFNKLVTEDETLEGNRQALSHRVPTCWNSDLECLLAHMHFKDIVEQLTAVTTNGLQTYCLTEEQWLMSADIQEILLVISILLVYLPLNLHLI